MALPTLSELATAASQIAPFVPATPQYCWPLLSQRAGCEVWVKHENHTPTGAFKVRGGLIFMADLVARTPQPAGIISATRGNHGQSLGFAARHYGLKATIVVPEGNSLEKNAAMQALGVELVVHGHDFQAAAEQAQALASDRGLTMVPPFHPLLLRGVGTYSLEFLQAVPDLDVVYVPIGLGSGICGMVAAREALGLTTTIVGVVLSEAPAYALSFAQQQPISHPVTAKLADGMACRQPVPEALEIIWQHVDRMVQVTESEVAAAMKAIFIDTHNVAEGAGAAGFAALLQEQDQHRGKKVGFVLCGGNVDHSVFSAVLSESFL
jgi:threonine dehydratase